MKTTTYVSIFFVLSLLILTGCGSTDVTENEKLGFEIQALSVNELSPIATREKVGSLLDQQQITVTAQAAGSVSSIPWREGQNVLSGEPIIQLADTISSYGLQVQRAQNALDRAIAQEEQTRLSLEDAIVAAEASLVQAEETLRVAQEGGILSLRWQELSAEQARIASESQLQNIQINFTSEYNTLKDLLVDVVDRGDSILGVTDRYRNNNIEFSTLLSAKDTQQRRIAETQLLQLYQTLDAINTLDTNDVLWVLDPMTNAYNQIATYLAQMQQVFINTVTAVNLPQAQLDGYVQTFASLQTRTQWSRAWFTAFRTQALSTLSDIDGSLAGTITEESASISLESTRLNTENTTTNAEIALANAERAYIQAQNNREQQIAILQTQIQDAQIAYQDTLRQAAKLSVWSPVRGALWEILVTPGQEVQPGTPLFSVIGTDNQLLQFTVNEKELWYLAVWQEVTIEHNNEQISWYIQSIPRLANNTMQYRVVVSADRALSTFGSTTRIHIPVETDYPLIPLASVGGVQGGQGIIHVLDTDNEVEKLSVTVWHTRWSMIELISDIPANYKIITNDISSYDPNDFEVNVLQ